MKKIVTLIPLIFISTLFTNCADSNNSVKPANSSVNKALPQWYTQAPENNARFIYGIGRGENRKHAIGEALNDAVSTLNVSVASSFNETTHVTSSNGSENVNSSADAELSVMVKKIELNNYKLLQHQTYGNEELVLIQINKQKLYTKLYDDIEDSFEMLEVQLQEKESDLEKILIYRHYLNAIRTKLKADNLLKSLNPAYDGEEFRVAFKDIAKKHNTLIEDKRFTLILNDPTHGYSNTIRNGLLQDGLKLTTNKDFDYLINVTIQEREEVAVRRQVITTLTTTITIAVGSKVSNKELHSTTFSIQSQSDISIEKARNANDKKLRELIIQNDIFSIPSN